MDRSAKCYMPGLSLDEAARRMATASGLFGTNLHYLQDIAEHFTILGIDDPQLFALHNAAQQIFNP